MYIKCKKGENDTVYMEKLENKKFWIWFSMIESLGSIRKQKLLKIYKSPENLYELSKKELTKIEGIGEKIATNISDEKIKQQLSEQMRKMKEQNVDIISINDKDYPQQLREMHDYPISLFIKGNKKILEEPSIAIIGCREASEYGKMASKYFGYELAKKGINIVSGLARGVDSYSHVGNICAKKEESYAHVDNLSTIGNPIAVVGNGLDIIYPKENEKLENEILNVGGAIISEYPLGRNPSKINFPARNRIISGLSKGVLVIEAKRKSGTLITVDFALDQGRDVFVMPGNINSVNSLGTNDLIKQGAKIVTCYQDILDSLQN